MLHHSSEQATDYVQYIEFIPHIRDFKLEYFTNALNKLIYYKQHPDAHYLILQRWYSAVRSRTYDVKA